MTENRTRRSPRRTTTRWTRRREERDAGGGGRFRSLLAMMASGLLVGGLLTAVGVATAAPATAALNDPISCGAVYGLDQNTDGAGSHRIWQVDTTTGALTVQNSFPFVQSLNGLAVDDEHGVFWAARQLVGQSATDVVRVNATTGAFTTYPATLTGLPSSTSGVVMGAYSAAADIFYYGAVANSILYIYGFDAATNTVIPGVIARVSLGSGNNGDFAFDSTGRLYIVSAGLLLSVNETLPTTGDPTGSLLTTTSIATPPGGTLGSVAFGGDGFLYLAGPPPGGGDRVIYRVNPSTGAVLETITMTPAANSIADLGSCASPNVITAMKNLPDGRSLPTDQFTLTVTGGSINQGNTGTTTGTDSGPQNTAAEMGGPVIGVPGQTYTVTETAAGTTFFTSYTSAWTCTDSVSGTTVGSGTGTTGTFTMPDNGSAGSNVQCTFDNDATPPDLAVTKTSDAPADPRPGDTITYTVTATNTGTGPYTAANPAVVFDDLSGVTDDAAYNNDATADRTGTTAYTSPVLSWRGALGVGQAVTLTYSVTLNAAGDGTVRNVAWHPNDPSDPTPPACDPPDGDGNDPVTGESCAASEILLPQLSIDKTADRTELPAVGETVQYTITVSNAGPGAYSAASPATATDDLSNVLDAADYNGDASATVGTVDVTGNTLSWSGALGANEDAVITYSVTYTGAGDQNLRNLACIPDESALLGASPCAVVQIPGAGLTQWKQVQASADPAVAGTVLTYTLFFGNDGETAATVDAVDSLVHVLDDADVTAEPTSANLSAVRTGDAIVITGSVPSGTVYAVTYQVTVRADGDRGDSIIANFLLDAGQNPPDTPVCTPADPDLPDCTSTPVSGLTYTKTVEASETPVQTGTALTYTVTIANTGATEQTVNRDDNLSGVLDDADLTTPASSDTATVTVLGPVGDVLGLRGTLAAGATAEITYTVTVRDPADRGDNRATNFLVPPETPPPATCDPATLTCTTTPIEQYTVSKVASTGVAAPGGTVEYTVTVTNTGTVAYTDANPASFTDDLTQVVDDATYNGDAASSTGVGAFTYVAPELSWSGPLAVGETLTITYSVTVDASPRDGTLTNRVTPTGGGGACDPAAECTTETLVSTFTVRKTADATSALPGDVITYTVTVTNTGAAAYTDASPASFTDDLSGVLDDAAYNGDATPGATVTGTTLTWTGPLAVDATVEVTYSVTVNDPVSGDGTLANVIAPNAPGGSCVPGECRTFASIASYTIAKAVDTTTAMPGDVVTYTITVTNTSEVAYTSENPASFRDNLAGVLDDATYNGDATEGATLDGTTLTWSGAIAPEGSITVTYSVTVNDPITGDFALENTATPSGPGGTCAEICETNTPLGSYTVSKTASSATTIPGGTVTYTVTVTNIGDVAYTDADPASFTDDLAAVLDDAVYNGDATSSTGAGVSYTAPELTWSGPLAVDATVTVTYSVTVNAEPSDGVLTNAVTPTAPGGTCPSDGACATETPVSSFTVEKTADATSAMPGDVITYTVTVTNTGAAAYSDDQPASFSDDLAAVLDDATYNGDVSTGGSVTGTTLTWSGTLDVGQTIDVTYSVTVNDPITGDSTLANTVTPTAPGGGCVAGSCATTTPVASFTVAKSVDATTAMPGDTVTYTVTVTNTGDVAYTAGNPAAFSDDLAGVLDDASYNGDATSGATLDGTSLVWSGPLAVGATVTVTYSVTVDTPVTGDFTLGNTVTPTAPGGTCADVCETSTPLGSLRVVKSTTSTEALPGDAITYTITVTNTGQVAYTDAAPASFTDDLAAVLDDAAYNADATSSNGGTVTYAAPTLAWTGPLAVGASTTITYSVTVSSPATGDQQLDNTVVTPPGIGANCEQGSTDPACTATVASGSFTVEKTANLATAIPGGVIVYTVTVTNTGRIAYTDAAPASFSDDLAGVLDDATYNGDATQGATVTGTTLTWTGPLAVDGTVEVTYSVTVNDPITGDAALANTVTPTAPGGGCLVDACSTLTPVASYTIAKSADVTTAMPGDTVTYTVTVTNTSDVAYSTFTPASFTDDLAGVLDDATYNGDATLGATVSGTTLTWTGPLPARATVTVTYSVTVNEPIAGDFVLTNAATPTGPGGTCPGVCETSTPLGSYTVSKTADRTTVNPGGTVAYTVTVTNTGQVAYTDAAPASFTDDLAAVLDDAAYNGDAVSSTGAGTVSYAAPALAWSGPLAVGASLTVTYSVTVSGDPSDDTLANTVTPTGAGGACDPGGACSTETLVSSFAVAKAADSPSAAPGDTVTYTVTVTNTGAAPYTDAAPASFTDDLSAVLDDATYNDDATAGASVTGSTLTWSGALAVGAVVTVSYSVTVDDPAGGDGSMANVVVPSAPGGACVPDECATVTPIASYTVAKSVDVASAMPGDVVTYSITVTNTGDVDYTAEDPASFTDDLSGVLDDATYNGDATGGATLSGATLSWSGALAAGGSATVTYSVTVDAPITGDFVLTNTAVPAGPGGTCAEVCETSTPLGSLRVVKSTEATEVLPGGVVTYTVTVTNTGQIDYTDASPASFTDDLTAVLDDAAYNADAVSDNGGTVDYTAPTLAWSGPLAIGATVTVTYSVTVDDPAGGDDRLGNTVVTPPGTGGNCEVGSTDPACSANVPSGSFTVVKTTDLASALPGDTVTYTITVTNTGDVAYTDASPASFSDDLSRVLDDATYNDDATEGATLTDTTLSWSGPLAAGAVVVVTYSVTVGEPVGGDHLLRNTVAPTAPGGECAADACTTDTPIAEYTVQKEADIADVTLGGTVVYTVTVTNIGQVDYTDAAPASFTDDLSAVLDDAVYNGDVSAGATVAGDTLTWVGALPVGTAAVVTYSVTVGAPATGDGVLRNTVAANGPGGGCSTDVAAAAVAAAAPCATETPVAAYRVIKTASARYAVVGDTVRFSVTVTNTGQVPFTEERPASFTDDLTAALALGRYNGDASGGAVYSAPVLSWQGALDPGETATVTYSVTVRQAGDILNLVVTPDGSGGNCGPGSSDPACRSLTTAVPPGLAVTGGVLWAGGVTIGVGLLLLGLWLARRRRTA